MGRLVVGAIAAASIFAGWANLPRIEQPASSAAGFLLAGAVLLAFWLGRRSVNADALAVAMASARAEASAAAHAGATAHSQVVVVTGDQGARYVAQERYGRPAWLGDREPDLEQLHGSDAVVSMLDDLREESGHEA